MSIRLAVRGYSGRTLVFEERIEAERPEDFKPIAAAQVERLCHYSKFMLEIELLDEPDITKRFVRFASDEESVQDVPVNRRMVMMVYIAQLKCPNGHVVGGAAGEFESEQEAVRGLSATLLKAVDTGQLKRECHTCAATEFHVDVRPTNFESLQDAVPRRVQEAERRASQAKQN